MIEGVGVKIREDLLDHWVPSQARSVFGEGFPEWARPNETQWCDRCRWIEAPYKETVSASSDRTCAARVAVNVGGQVTPCKIDPFGGDFSIQFWLSLIPDARFSREPLHHQGKDNPRAPTLPRVVKRAGQTGFSKRVIRLQNTAIDKINPPRTRKSQTCGLP